MIPIKPISPWNKVALVLMSFIFVFGAGELITFLQKRGLHLPFDESYAFPLAVLIIIGIAFAIIVIIDRQPLSTYGFAKLKKKDWGWLIAFLFFLMPIALLGRLIDPGFDQWYAGQSGLAFFAGLILFSLAMPLYVIKEELVVRSIMQNKLRTLGFWWMALAVSLNFAIAHFYVPSWGIAHIIIWVISVFVGSFLLIMCYEVTRNIWISLILHLVFNILIGLQIFLHVAMPPLLEWAFWAVMMAGSVLAFLKFFKPALRHFREERFGAISWKDAAFLLLFAVIYPVLLAISWKYFAIGLAATAWIFFL